MFMLLYATQMRSHMSWQLRYLNFFGLCRFFLPLTRRNEKNFIIYCQRKINQIAFKRLEEKSLKSFLKRFCHLPLCSAQLCRHKKPKQEDNFLKTIPFIRRIWKGEVKNQTKVLNVHKENSSRCCFFSLPDLAKARELLSEIFWRKRKNQGRQKMPMRVKRHKTFLSTLEL